MYVNIMGAYPTHFRMIDPLLKPGYFLSSQMDTGDPAFSDFMDNIMFRPDGSGKAPQWSTDISAMYVHAYIYVACVELGHNNIMVSCLIKGVILIWEARGGVILLLCLYMCTYTEYM